ncbi:MAG: protein phosphatase [Parcubacteria group bacterium Gr01-1014_38]|nr:MAG: protein phosphatase [Parcubacteria group bacterium Gr01-1014_38]
MSRAPALRKGLVVGWSSVPSDTHRTRNEDAFLVMLDRGFFGVFDGMGGYRHADIAAQIAADEVQETLAPLAPDASDEAVADTLRDAFFAADAAIRAEAHSRSGAGSMGTTALLAVVRPAGVDTWSTLLGWVGDSRVLVLPEGSRFLHTLTLDDSVLRLHASSATQARKYQAALGMVTDSKHLSLRERDLFLERHVLTQAVGTSLRHVHVTAHLLSDGDLLILTTDGVHDNLTDREITAILRRARSVGDASKQLVTAARVRSRDREHVRAKPDDMTAVIVRLSG